MRNAIGLADFFESPIFLIAWNHYVTVIPFPISAFFMLLFTSYAKIRQIKGV